MLYDIKSRTIFIYGDIGTRPDEISDKAIADALLKLGPGAVTVRVNSYGGAVDTGVAMFELLRQHRGQVTTIVDGTASSIASVILLAGAVRQGADSSIVMIHNPWGIAVGDADDFRKTAGVLDIYRERLVGIYIDRTSMPESKVREAMKAETYFPAADALKQGFLTGLIGQNEAQNKSRSFPKRDAAYKALAERKLRRDFRDHWQAVEERRRAEYVGAKIKSASSKGISVDRYPPAQFPKRAAASLAIIERRIRRRRDQD